MSGTEQYVEDAAARNDQGAALFAEGRYREAAQSFEAALASCRAAFGPDHGATLTVAGNLGVAQVAAGQRRQGLKLMSDNLADRIRVLGDDHPDTLTTRDALAAVHRTAGNVDDAVALSGKVALQRARKLGPTHPDTLTSRMGLALAHLAAGDLPSAHRLLAAALSDAEEAYGARHHLTLTLLECGRAFSLIGTEAGERGGALTPGHGGVSGPSTTSSVPVRDTVDRLRGSHTTYVAALVGELDLAAGLAHVRVRQSHDRYVSELASRLEVAGGLADLIERQHGATDLGDVVAPRPLPERALTTDEEAVGAARSVREAQRAAAVARKRELAAEAEALAAESTQWKQAGDRFKVILDEWRTIRGIDRAVDEQMWKRFSRAHEAFNRRRVAHFADLDRQRASATAYKPEMVTEAERLAESQDWGETAAHFRDLMVEWKVAGHAPTDTNDTLRQRFRRAQNTFVLRPPVDDLRRARR